MSKKWQYISSTYKEAWVAFRRTDEYKQISENLKKAGYRQPYRDNVIKTIFAAGFRGSDVEIKLIKKG